MDYSAPPALRTSDALHKRVLAFALNCQKHSSLPSDSFETLALDIARFQLEHSPGLARLCSVGKTKLKTLDQLPVVPCDVFRLTRVALHPAALDEAVFRTSGTTTELTGRHPVRKLNTKEQLTLLQANHTLFSEFGRGIVVALATSPDGSSSLGHMMELFMRHFDARPLRNDPTGANFSVSEPGRFLVSQQGIDIEGLHRAARLARHRAEPLYILATSFAMAATLDALDGERIAAPSRTKIMLTGGFKGRTKQVDESALREAAARCFGLDPSQIVGEYGMTELSSQLFEQPHSNATAHQSHETTRPNLWWQNGGPAGTYFAPPWLRVRALSAQTYEPVPDGEPGLAHFIDLANIDSCISVLTQDMITLTAGGVRLWGRAAEAPARGCSLPFESMMFAPSDRENPV